MLNFFISEVLV